MINELRKKLEKQARILKKLEPIENSLNDLQVKLDDIRDKFTNPNDYPELLNDQTDIDIELEEIELYFNEQIEKQKDKKQKLENQMIQDYKEQMNEISEGLISAQEEKDKIDKRLKFWESKTNIKSPSALKRVEVLKERRRTLGFEIDNLVKKRNEIISEQNVCLNGILFQKGIIDRYQKLKEEVITRKKQKFNNGVFGLLKNQAYQLEQLFYTLNSQRNKLINDNRAFLAEFNLSKMELAPFNYTVIDVNSNVEMKDDESEEIKESGSKDNTLTEKTDIQPTHKMTRMERLHPEKFKELQELKNGLISETQIESNAQALIPETTAVVKENNNFNNLSRAERVRKAEETYDNPSIPNYFNHSENLSSANNVEQYDVNQTKYPTPAVLTPKEIGKRITKI